MRKSASIILLFILLFNIIGYRAWFYYAERKADIAMETRLDKEQYDENDLVSITVPLDNPYQLEQKSFQRIDGEISFQGKTFRYVKRMVSDGKLIVLCIPDARKMVLKKAKTEFGYAANDMTGNSKGSSRSGSQKNFGGSDYTIHHLNLRICPFAHLPISIQNGCVIGNLSDAYISTLGKPPQSTMA